MNIYQEAIIAGVLEKMGEYRLSPELAETISQMVLEKNELLKETFSGKL